MNGNFDREWYVISTGLTVCAASAMTPISKRIPDDSDFLMAQILVPRATSMSFRFQIKKATADKYLSNNPLEIIALLKAGTNLQEPYDIPPEGRVLFPSGTDIIFEITDYSAAPNSIDFVVGGFKIRKSR